MFYKKEGFTFVELMITMVIFILTLLFPGLEREFPDWTAGQIFLAVVVLAPAIETLLLQALPIFIARKFKAPFAFQIAASMAVFATLHIFEGILTAIAAGLVGGFYFAFSYAHWCQKSHWTAFWVTAFSHTFNNAFAFTLLVLTGQL